MFGKSSTASTLLITASLLGNGLAAPFGDVVEARHSLARSSMPIPAPDGQDASLKDQEYFLWNQGPIISNLTASADGNTTKIIHSSRMSQMIQSVNCLQDGQVSMTFNDSNSMETSKAAWQWVETPGQSIIMVIDDEGACGGPEGRQPYLITQCDWDPTSKTVKMNATSESWTNVLADYTMHVKTKGFDTRLDKRQVSTPNNTLLTIPGFNSNDNIDTSIDLSKASFSKTIFSETFDGILFSLDCDGCGLTGMADVDLTIGLTTPPKGKVTFSGAGLQAKFDLKAQGTLTKAISIDLPLLPPLALIPGEQAGGLSPTISIHASGGIASLTAEVDASFGVNVNIGEGATISIDGLDVSHDNFDFSLTPIEPVLSASVTIDANIKLAADLDLSLTLAGETLADIGFQLLAPELDASVSAQTNTEGGVCGDANAFAGVQFNVGAGAELDFVASAKIIGGTTVTLATTSFEIISTCLALGGAAPTPEAPEISVVGLSFVPATPVPTPAPEAPGISVVGLSFVPATPLPTPAFPASVVGILPVVPGAAQVTPAPLA